MEHEENVQCKMCILYNAASVVQDLSETEVNQEYYECHDQGEGVLRPKLSQSDISSSISEVISK